MKQAMATDFPSYDKDAPRGQVRRTGGNKTPQPKPIIAYFIKYTGKFYSYSYLILLVKFFNDIQ